MRTFEDARSEIVTCVEEKIGLRIRKPNEAGFCERADPTDVLGCQLSPVEENGHQIRAVFVSKVMHHIFTRLQMQASTWANKRRALAIRASHGP